MENHASVVLNAILITLSLVSLTNFFVPIVWGPNEISYMINTWSLVISGLLINAGTAIQIIVNAVLNDNTLQFNYISCLVSGCLLLVSGQLFTYVHKSVRDVDFLVSLFGSCLSLVFTIALMVINKCNSSKIRYRSNTMKTIVYYEGTSGVGKTTNAMDSTYDYTDYTNKQPLYKFKQSLPYVQTMYLMQLYSDIILDLLKFSRDKSATVSSNDRHIFSQLAYDIIFFYKGERTNPEEFCKTVDRVIFNDHNYVKLLKLSMTRVVDTVTAVAPNTRMNIDWFVSGDVKFTKQKLIDRGGFEIYQPDWNLEWYVHNQNYVFRKLWEISGIGNLHIVKLVPKRMTYVV